MLTVDYDRLGVRAGERVLDLGCGAGRHAFAAHRRGALVVAVDLDAGELSGAKEILDAMTAQGEAPADALGAATRANALRLPFPDGTFDRVIVSEVLEHIPDDAGAVAELTRVLRPGGTMAVTVPAWLPERLCWALSAEYHAVDGGHIRIYTAAALADRLKQAGLVVQGTGHAHAFHSPYWWLRCAIGVRNDANALARLYHRFLVWDMTTTSRPVRWLEKTLDPIIGKSLVLYTWKPSAARKETRAFAAA
ncbi:MAG: rebM [Acidimicrobiales bacterium]|jgi:SAM-dependent methyltransferase|nr:rebM [Acidimicrobiales bacterium]